MFFKLGVLKNFADFAGIICFGVSFGIYQKETPTQVFSCQTSEISKNTFSYRIPLMAASEGFIPYITDPLGHSGLIMESKTFAKMDGKM